MPDPQYYSLERNREQIKAAIHDLISSRQNWGSAYSHSQATEGHEPLASIAETLAGLLDSKTVSPAGVAAAIAQAIENLDLGAPAQHNHSISEVVGLVEALSLKAPLPVGPTLIPRYDITGRVGGSASDLDGIATLGVIETKSVIQIALNGVLESWQLIDDPGGLVEDGEYYVYPDDNAIETNERIFIRIQ